MARTLKDVYIKVTENNKKELESILKIKVPNNYNLSFSFDNVYCVYMHDRSIDKQKVSLSELKRLIDTIPTREEITRLKRQISAYKTNYDKVVKHSLSKEDVIEDLQNNNSDLIQKLVKANRGLKSKYNEIHKLKNDIKKVRCERDSLDASFKNINEMYDDLVVESGKKQNLLKNLYDDALKEIEVWKQNDKKSLELIKEINDDNLYLITEYEKVKKENEQLKNKKWWQIWK